MFSARFIPTVVCGLFLSTSAHAADPAVTEGLKIAAGGANGAAACASCHGAQGEGNPAAGFPHLAGLGAAYLSKQLNDIADGIRSSLVMQPIAKALSTNERSVVAAYYASLAPPFDSARVAASARADVTPSDRGAWLATRGAWEKDIPACNQCHGPGGIGVGGMFPALAGQSRAYLAAQLTAWQNGQRSPLPLGLMPAVATKLSAQDIDAVTTYYAGLPTQADEKKAGGLQ